MAERKRVPDGCRRSWSTCRSGRTFVYEQARLYLATGGAEGLPCRRFGRLLRFPLDEVDGPRLPDGRATVVDLDARRRRATPPARSPRRRAARSPPRPASRATGTDQSTLPFTD